MSGSAGNTAAEQHPLLRWRDEALQLGRDRGVVLGIAVVVGIYAGIAAGLFAHAIRFVQIVLLRGSEVFTALFGSGHAQWRPLFEQRLLAAHWHLEFAGLSALGLVLAFVAEVLERRGKLPFPLADRHRVRSLALAGAFGLALYYPLLVVATFNGTFHETGGGLYELIEAAPLWLRVLAPVFGAIAAGLIVRYVSPESGGHGVVEVIEAVHGRGKQLRGRVAVWKSLASGLVIGSGGSAGREGPVVHLGGAVASSLSRSLNLHKRDAALLMACGAGAGIAASFHAPLAGTLFALEIVLGDFGVRRLAPIVLSCVVATATSHALLGAGTDLETVAWTLHSGWEIGLHFVLGVLAGLGGVLYVRSLHYAEELFAGRRGGAFGAWLGGLPPELRAAAGGLCLGVVGVVSPRVLGTGIESMNAALAGELTVSVLIIAFALKLIATSATLGSGAPGGSFFPAVFLGAMLGGAFGHAASFVLPAGDAHAYVAVGMGALVAAATVAPLTGVLMMFELTGSAQIILPLLVACGTAAAVAHSRLGGSIYALGARRRGVILPVQGAALSELEVGMALDRVEPVPAELLLSDLLPRLLEQPGQAFPVTNDAQQLVGIFSIAAARHALLTRELHTLRVREVMRPALPRFVTDDDLQVALHTLAEGDAAAGLVVDEHGRSLGVITREGILEAWRRSTIAEEQH